MADQPRKAGVYDKDADTRTTPHESKVEIEPGRRPGASKTNWWIVALVVLLILVAIWVLF